MKAFLGLQDVKDAALADARDARLAGQFYAFGHHWHEGRGNVSGAMYHHYLKAGEAEQLCPDYSVAVHGIPPLFMEMIDAFFSNLSLHSNKDIHQHWAETVYGAIVPGADLRGVPDRLATYILEQADWLAAYADEKVAHQVGLLHGIFLMRCNGIDQTQRLADFYHDHIHKLQRHQTEGKRDLSNYARAAMRSLCSIDQYRGPYSYFLQYVVDGSAAHHRESKGKRWVELSQIFLQMIEDCRP